MNKLLRRMLFLIEILFTILFTIEVINSPFPIMWLKIALLCIIWTVVIISILVIESLFSKYGL